MLEDGEVVPEEVPGVMLPTVNGEEEAFVPADLLQDAENLIAAASAQQPSFLPPEQYQPQQPGGVVEVRFLTLR